jgi:hypothetical protein
LVIIATILAPNNIIGIAYDSSGVTTSTLNVQLITALGVGLASSIRGRNPMTDGFGMIAIASLLPIVELKPESRTTPRQWVQHPQAYQ